MEPNLPLSLVAFGDGAVPFAAIIAGVAGVLPGGLYSRLLPIHGDTHVHPTAFGIFAGDGVVIWCASLAAGYKDSRVGRGKGVPTGRDQR